MIQHLDARIGVTRSFGSLRETGREPIPPAASWEVGAMFALQPRTLPTFPTMSAYPSLGIWWSWNISRYVSWDSTVMHSGRTPGVYTFSDYQAGGRALEILTGTKIGIRRDHMGYFAKIRGGTITFGETERQLTVVSSSEFTADRGMFTSPVLDAGGVLEVYPSRHCILRFDAGSATIFYQPKDVYQQGIRYAVPGETQPTMLMSFGAGFRF
jgi:hypothetical protein